MAGVPAVLSNRASPPPESQPESSRRNEKKEAPPSMSAAVPTSRAPLGSSLSPELQRVRSGGPWRENSREAQPRAGIDQTRATPTSARDPQSGGTTNGETSAARADGPTVERAAALTDPGQLNLNGERGGARREPSATNPAQPEQPSTAARALGVIGDTAQIITGGAIAVGGGPLGWAAGGAIVVDGVARLAHRVGDWSNGETTDTYQSQLMQYALPRDTANRADVALNMATTLPAAGVGVVNVFKAGGTLLKSSAVASGALVADSGVAQGRYVATGEQARPLTVSTLMKAGLTETQANYAVATGAIVAAGGMVKGAVDRTAAAAKHRAAEASRMDAGRSFIEHSLNQFRGDSRFDKGLMREEIMRARDLGHRSLELETKRQSVQKIYAELGGRDTTPAAGASDVQGLRMTDAAFSPEAGRLMAQRIDVSQPMEPQLARFPAEAQQALRSVLQKRLNPPDAAAAKSIQDRLPTRTDLYHLAGEVPNGVLHVKYRVDFPPQSSPKNMQLKALVQRLLHKE